MVSILWLYFLVRVLPIKTFLQKVNSSIELKFEMCSVLVTGANRGIGLGLVKHLLSNQAFNVENVFATCRDMGKAKVIIYLLGSTGAILKWLYFKVL